MLQFVKMHVTGVIRVTSDYMTASEYYSAGGTWQNRHNWLNMAAAAKVADEVNEQAGEELYMAIDNGRNVSPRYDVILCPRVGEPVSMTFNGDSYPCGEIATITAGTRRVITTTDGTRFYRRKLTGTWLYAGTWSMIHGHVNTRNPSF